MTPHTFVSDSCRVTVRRLALALLLVLLAGTVSLVAGCGSGGTAEQASPTTDEPTRGGTLTVAFQGEPATLDPAIDWDSGWNTLYSVASGLLKFAPGSGAAGNVLEPDLAASLPEVSADGKTYVFKIREGLRFAPPSDAAITAQDFKWSMERMMSLPTAPGTYLYSAIDGADEFVAGKAGEIRGYQVVDDHTIKIQLKNPDPTILYCLALPFAGVVPQDVVESKGKAFGRLPVCAGPFMIEEWKTGQYISLKRNPNYWNADKVWLDEVNIEIGVTPSVAVLRVQSGELDLTGENLPSADIRRLQMDPTWKSRVFSEPFLNTTYLYLNVNMEPFDDPVVRKAVSLSIDRAKVAKVLAGSATALNNVYPDGLAVSADSVPFPEYDVSAAKSLLSEAGYESGLKTTLHCRNTEPMPKLLQSIQYDLKQIGIEADIELHPQSTYWTLIGQPDKMASGLSEWYMDYPDPSNIIRPLLGKESAKGGGFNASFWWNPEVEKLMAAADLVSNPEERTAKYAEISQIVVDDVPMVPLVQQLRTVLAGEDVGGFFVTPRGVLSLADYWKVQAP